MADSLTDAAMLALGGTGSIRDRQMAAHVTAGRTSGTYIDRCVVAGTPFFPK